MKARHAWGQHHETPHIAGETGTD